MGHSSAYIYKEGNTKVARATLCIWVQFGQHVFCQAFISRDTLRAAHSLEFLGHIISAFVSIWGRVPDFLFLQRIFFGVSCAASSSVNAGLVSDFTRSSEQYDFHPILKLRPLLSTFLPVRYGVSSGDTFSTWGLATFLITNGVLRFWTGRDLGLHYMTCMEADSPSFFSSYFDFTAWAVGRSIRDIND
jgi:hypothetical protein